MPDPSDKPFELEDSAADREPDTIATPEGDNEYPPDAPLGSTPEGLQRTPAINTNKL